ncbi:MAG: M24 family metallopeptidase [Solirubrobacteraceae bacterium]
MSTSATADGPRARRAARLASDLAGLELDALMVDSLHDVGYLTGFTGSHAIALVVADSARGQLGPDRFFSDFRYETQSAEQVLDGFEREIVTGDLIDALARVLSGRSGRLGFDDAGLSVKAHRHLGELLGDGWELVATGGAVQRLRSVKDAGEIARIRAASELADEALRLVLEDGLVGRTERDVAIELELRMRRLGAQAPSFPSIIASGDHAALPHAEPRDHQIARDVLVTVDWGALHEGYCSDCTRTYATGEGISTQSREIHALVLCAEERGVAAVAAGRSGREVDALAREVIERAGQGENFGHGLGHGVGMEVHEGPRLSRTAGEEPLQAGNVVTVEPGVYLPGVLGVRIEDLVVVGADSGSQEVLTSLPKALTVVS